MRTAGAMILACCGWAACAPRGAAPPADAAVQVEPEPPRPTTPPVTATPEIAVPWKPAIPQLPIGALAPTRSWCSYRTHAVGRELLAVCGFYIDSVGDMRDPGGGHRIDPKLIWEPPGSSASLYAGAEYAVLAKSRDTQGIWLRGGKMVLQNNYHLAGISLRDAAVVWQLDLPGWPRLAVVRTFHGERVIAASERRVLAIDLARGSISWDVEVPDADLGDPSATSDGERVILLSSVAAERQLIALEARTGREAWRTRWPERCKPRLIAEPGLLVADCQRSIHGFDPATGQRRWTWDVPAQAGYSWELEVIGVRDGLVVASEPMFGVAAFDARTQRERWLLDVSMRDIALGEDAVYVRTGGGEVRAFALATGVEHWRWHTGDPWVNPGGPNTLATSQTSEGEALVIGAEVFLRKGVDLPITKITATVRVNGQAVRGAEVLFGDMRVTTDARGRAAHELRGGGTLYIAPDFEQLKARTRLPCMFMDSTAVALDGAEKRVTLAVRGRRFACDDQCECGE